MHVYAQKVQSKTNKVNYVILSFIDILSNVILLDGKIQKIYIKVLRNLNLLDKQLFCYT